MSTLGGLPAHPLLVHAAVILVPMAALLVLAVAFWPAARPRIGGTSPLLALVAVICAFLTKKAGEHLATLVAARSGADGEAIGDHAGLGDAVVVWALVVFAVAVMLYLVHGARMEGIRRRAGVLTASWVVPVTMGLALVSAAGAVYSVVTAGHSGSELVWSAWT